MYVYSLGSYGRYRVYSVKANTLTDTRTKMHQTDSTIKNKSIYWHKIISQNFA